MEAVLKVLAPLHATGKWLVLAAIVGVVAGLGAIAFDATDETIGAQRIGIVQRRRQILANASLLFGRQVGQ